jgi:hypothetical protein
MSTRVAEALDVFPLSAVVKVDDTLPGACVWRSVGGGEEERVGVRNGARGMRGPATGTALTLPSPACLRLPILFPPAAGILEGLNAGMWTVGVARSGNELGLSWAEAAELQAGKPAEYKKAMEAAHARMAGGEGAWGWVGGWAGWWWVGGGGAREDTHHPWLTPGSPPSLPPPPPPAPSPACSWRPLRHRLRRRPVARH